jgi:heptaprenyl diphosphate synthase
MSHTLLLSPRRLQYADEIITWARTFLVPDNTEMRRPVGSQAICPFVEASLDQDAFYMVFHPEVNGVDHSHVEDILGSYIEDFLAAPPYDDRRTLKALLVIFTNISSENALVLPYVATKLKDEFVKRGLMIAPFYPKCDDRSVHNPALRVSQSPYPMVAIRHMAIHDILFLADEPSWFDSYNRRFGDRFKEPEKIEDFNRHLLVRYDQARKKHLSK